MISKGMMAAAALSAWASSIPSAQAGPVKASDDAVFYTTRPGDNLYTLARRYFVRTEDYARVQRLNRVRDPYRIPVGRVLRIPRAILRHVPLIATVIAQRGQVAIRHGGQVRFATVGSGVREDDMVVTTENAFVSLRLPDGSVVSLPSRSTIGVRRLRRILLTGGIERLFALENGRTRAIVTPARNPDDSFRISTPVAVSAVRGTQFRIRYDPAGVRATTEVLEGHVAVGAARADAKPALIVPAGFGTLATATGPSGAIGLLPPPALRQPGQVQDEAELRFALAPLPDASAYRIQIASDAGFLDVVEETTAPATSLVLPSVPDGTWFVRASAIDANGIEGVPSTYGFERRLQHIETSIERRRAGRYREYLFRWTVASAGAGAQRYRFQLRKDASGEPPVVDELGLTAGRFVVTDLPPGAYTWRVQSLLLVDGRTFLKWSPIERLTIARDE
ncbi:MAG TPA: FecR domain-containing protein [Novosphingobium sp.]